ncbi:MAG: hypothetical protein WCE30_25895 [Mycobacterium sp.]
MTGNDKSTRWGRVLRYGTAALLLLLAAVTVLRGGRWYETAIMVIPAMVLLLGSGRQIYRSAINRSGEEITCRFIPWFEPLVYGCGVLLPAIGIAGIFMGSDPGYPRWFQYSGIFLVCLGALLAASFLRAWRMSRLCIRPTTLTIRLPLIRPPASLRGPTDIRRDQVKSIEPKIVRMNMGVQILRVVMVFQADDADDTTTVLLGPQFTIDPMNLLGGLLAWKDGAADDPGELMDRIEGILRGHSTESV